ncbi:class I SAM-dependent methyltransferase [Intrasporangium mesophilum]
MDEMPAVLEDLFGFYAIVLLGLGRRAGFTDALLAGPGTASDIAGRASADERSCEEWLRAMTARGYASHERGMFSPTDSLRMTFDPGFPVDAASGLEGCLGMAAAYGPIVDAWRDGRGLDGIALSAFSAFSGLNTPLYGQVLVEDWIGGTRGLADALEHGGQIAEVGAGNGAAASLVARAFPGCHVVGYDLRAGSASDLPSNAELRSGDARSMAADGPFDLVYTLDTLHHIADAEVLISEVRSALAPGGLLLVAENDLSGDVDTDVANPFGFVSYASSALYCLQEPLAAGAGTVHTGAENPRWIADAMTAAGFSDVSVRSGAGGMAIVTGRA